MRRRLLFQRQVAPAFPSRTEVPDDGCGISSPFELLSPTERQITYVLLTRPPLYSGLPPFSLDLHVLGPPLTFALSQDQTLHVKELNLSYCTPSHTSRRVPTCSESG